MGERRRMGAMRWMEGEGSKGSKGWGGGGNGSFSELELS